MTETNGHAGNGKATDGLASLVMKSLANEFFKTMQDGAESHQKSHSGDYDLISTGIKNETEVANLWTYLSHFNADGSSQ